MLIHSDSIPSDLREFFEPAACGQCWTCHLVDVFRECRRVLRSDGVFWLEVGDTYAANRTYQVTDNKHRDVGNDQGSIVPPGCKPKDLVGAPWMLAFALRADGWYLRSDTIWARPNPMPESVTDRPTKAHSYVFLLTKSARYYYDADAIREDAIYAGKTVTLGPKSLSRGQATGKGIEASGNGLADSVTVAAGRNARSVWSIATEPTPFAHFATMPQALVERCIKAGTSEHGCCSECGAPWVRVVERTLAEPVYVSGKNVDNADRNDKGRNSFRGGGNETTGWETSCDCLPGMTPYPPATVPCAVLDPFMGSGTTALVARRLGRHAIGIELNADYIKIAATRLQQLSLLGGAA